MPSNCVAISITELLRSLEEQEQERRWSLDISTKSCLRSTASHSALLLDEQQSEYKSLLEFELRQFISSWNFHHQQMTFKPAMMTTMKASLPSRASTNRGDADSIRSRNKSSSSTNLLWSDLSYTAISL